MISKLRNSANSEISHSMRKQLISSMRYIYLGDRMTDPQLKGKRCDPVRRPDGKCICGRGAQLVVFEDGVSRVVVRRMLRVTEALRIVARP